MDRIVAIDIGGTTIKSAVAEVPPELAATQIGAVRRDPTPVGDADRLVHVLADLVASYGNVARVGLVMPGVLDVPAGRVRAAGNMRLFDVPIVEPLQALLGLPVSFEHDVRAGALAELHAGAARGRQDAAFLPIGTGIAAAFIIDGEVRSSDGYMGEVGHAYVGPDELCVCGLHGCLEAVASASAIARRYAAAGGTGDAAQVIAHAEAGEAAAARVWNDALAGLALACGWIANLLGPEVIIIGGGLARAGDALFVPLRERLRSKLSYQRTPELLPAVHGDDAGCLGAAVLALRAQGVR